MAMAAEFTFQLQKSRPNNYFMRRLEWRFADSFTSGATGEYTLEMITPIMIGLADALDALADDPAFKDKIGKNIEPSSSILPFLRSVGLPTSFAYLT